MSLTLPLMYSCKDKNENPAVNSLLHFAQGNGSIKLPAGFQAVVVADNLGQARHLAIAANGDVYVSLGDDNKGNSLVALHDEDGDGVADDIQYFGHSLGTGIRLHKDYLYYSTYTQVFRQKFEGNELIPSGPDELMVTLPGQSSHSARSLAFDDKGFMYVNVGAPSNVCQDPEGQPGASGLDPCPLLQNHAGIWRFSDSQQNQQQSDGVKFASGIRNAVALTWNNEDGNLYAVQHGRDQLHELWPDLYTEQESAELPAEEMIRIKQGDDFGWPYCYYDQNKHKKLLNPEYGGDKETVGRCTNMKDPILAFPGHWAPDGIVFYNNATSFPQKYHHGAFIAFHGSWNRAPLPQQGYKVVFVPFQNGEPTGNYEDFATEFANDGGVLDEPANAEYRPCGLAIGPDGSLYISDSVKGRIWRVVYTGK